MNTTDARRWAAARARFEELVELSPKTRAARLAELATADPDLAREVESLLAADAEEERTALERAIAGGAVSAASAIEEERAAADAAALAGLRLGAWRLTERLGTGGMAQVWAAERADGLFEQTVAVKLLKRGMDSEEIVRRFSRERQILGRLEHPAIARITDGGLAPDGRPYLVMERVEGEPITDWCARREAGLAERMRLVADACDAVAAAHRLLVVHRDLKPSNLLVTADGRIKLLDFGIAKLLAEDDVDHDRLTRHDLRLLTPAYAAPEQILGEPVGTATDVYALGLIAFELATGRRPLARSATSAAELARSVERETVPRPSRLLVESAELGDARWRRRRAKELDGDLDTVILAALRREPERRYASAVALADDLRAWLAGRPIAARREAVGYRGRLFVRRHRLGVAAAALSLLSLVGGLAAALSQARRADRAALAAESEAARAARARDLLASVFEAADPAKAQGKPPTARELLDEGARRADRELGADRSLHGEMLDLLAGIYRKLGELEPAERLARRALELRTAAHGADSAEVGRTLQTLGWTLLNEGKMADARIALERSIAILDHAGGSDAESEIAAADAREPLVELEFAAAGPPAALPVAEERLEIYRRRLGDDDPRTAIAWNDVGVVQYHLGKLDEAERAYLRSAATVDAKLGANDPRVAYPHNNLATLLLRRGEAERAEAEARKALAIRRAALGDRHPDTAQTLGTLAQVLLRKDLAGAEAAAREALAIYEGRDPFETAQTRALIGTVLDRSGRSAEGVAELERAINDYLKVVPPHHYLVETARGHHARALAKLGRHAEAAAELEQVVDALGQGKSAKSETYQNALDSLADELAGLGRTAEAIARRRAALAVATERLGADHPTVARLGDELAALERRSSARAN